MRVAAVLAVAAVYAGLYKLVVASSSFGASVGAPFWPPAGFTLAVLLLRPKREWPGYLAAIFATETALDIESGFGVAVSPFMGLANTVEPLVAAYLLRRWLGGPTPDLSALRDLGLFIVAGAAIAPLMAAIIGSIGPWLVAGDPIWPRLPRWYVGDALGVLTLAPVIVTAVRMREGFPRLTDSWAAVPLIISAGVALGPWEFSARLGLPFIVIPALALVGMRLGTRAVATALFGVAVLVETTTALGVGPFAVHGPFDGLVVAQMYLATCAMSALAVAALMTGFVSRGELALSDPLTGLANRRLLFDRIDLACRQLRRRPGHVALLFVDIDGLKWVNDTYGHEAGDQVLLATADRLRAVVRDEDTVARLGGDEFVVLLSYVENPQALPVLAGRIEATIAEPIELGDELVSVGTSVGISTTASSDAVAETLLAEADQAMYAVKRVHAVRGAQMVEAVLGRDS